MIKEDKWPWHEIISAGKQTSNSGGQVTLAGVGGEPQVYTPNTGGKIWTVILKNNDGVIETIEAYGADEILQEPVGHGPLKSYQNKFLHVSSEVFDSLLEKPFN